MSIPVSHEQCAARWLLWLVLAGACSAAVAQGLDVAAERERIARERSQVEAVARERQAECARQFVVSTCAEAARRQRSEQLRQIDRQRALLEESIRKQRAAERQAALAARREAETAAAPAVQVRPRTTDRKGDAEPKPARRAGVDDAERAHAPARSASVADSQAAMRARAASARASEAAAHRAEVEQRNRDRAVKRKPALPLPHPASVPAPSPTS